MEHRDQRRRKTQSKTAFDTFQRVFLIAVTVGVSLAVLGGSAEITPNLFDAVSSSDEGMLRSLESVLPSR